MLVRSIIDIFHSLLLERYGYLMMALTEAARMSYALP